MRTRPQIVVTLSALVALAFPVSAVSQVSIESRSPDHRYDPGHQARFRAADSDNSRGLSREEIEAGMPRVLLRHFDEIDLDGNGELSPEELEAMRVRENARRDARRQQRLQELRGGVH